MEGGELMISLIVILELGPVLNKGLVETFIEINKGLALSLSLSRAFTVKFEAIRVRFVSLYLDCPG